MESKNDSKFRVIWRPIWETSELFLTKFPIYYPIAKESCASDIACVISDLWERFLISGNKAITLDKYADGSELFWIFMYFGKIDSKQLSLLICC